jgi:hypothetical protein
MQPRPRAEVGEAFAQRLHARLEPPPAPLALGVAQVHAVGARVLRHHQQFAHAAAHQVFRFPEHLVDRTRDEVAAHRGDDAERATVVAALGNLEVGIVLRRQLDADAVDAAGAKAARRRHQVDEGVVPRRQRGVHRLHHAGVVLRPRDGQHAGVCLADDRGALAQAPGHDHLAVFLHRLADRVQRFGHRGIDEAAGVDHHHVGRALAGHDLVALDPQLGEDAFGIDQCLGAAEADEADLRVATRHAGSQLGRTGDSSRPGAPLPERVGARPSGHAREAARQPEPSVRNHSCCD